MTNTNDNELPEGSGVPPVSRARVLHDHAVQFYGEVAGLIESVSGYIGEVLVENNVALIVAIPEHRKMLAGRLAERGFDLPRIIGEGRYVELDAEEALSSFLVEGWPDQTRYRETMAQHLSQLRRAAKGNPPRLAILGEMVGLLCSQGRFDAALRLEQLWNELQETESFSLRCAYPMKQFEKLEHAEGFVAICQEHTHVVPGESYTDLRELAARQLSRQDEERRRVAHGLRDGTGKDLAQLSMNLSDLADEARLLNPGLARNLETNCDAVRRMSQDLREFTNSLHPAMLDEMGLSAAIGWYVTQLQKRSKMRVEVDVPSDFGRLSRDLETALFRIAQECLTNVEKHSGSANAAVRLVRDEKQIRLSVTDHGAGMPSERLLAIAALAESRSGLRGIRERVHSFGGEMQIVSGADGTEIRVTVRATP